ncbi:MAG: ATP-binding cassette domain-containing protein, partial [Acidaminococcaceae bacterium]|nr:ATP-binding cassette domain-containing protein [Acidaminococcaceae bacterium]
YITGATPKVLQYKDDLDDYTYEVRIKKVLIGLGYTQEWWDRDAATLSGGQKTRLLLACALAQEPDFLILDEPTNHLDILMMEWLEGYLREFKGAVLLVSHDRAFLDNVVSRVLEAERGVVQSFRGNYSAYVQQKELQQQSQQAAYDAQQEYIARTEAYIRRFKAGIKSKQARGRQSQLNRLERLDAPVEQEEFVLRLPSATECANRVGVFDHLTIGYGEKVLCTDINLELLRGEKVALIGANGSGKSTLLKTLLGEVQPLFGNVKIGNRVQIGYFSQSYERLNPEETLLDNFLNEYGFTIEHTRSLLGGMLFHGDDVFKKIGELSGGQKARLVLLKLVLDGANFLVLDEPTNHLDILARETVEAALCAFDGTVLLVTHDRVFVQEIADRIWEMGEGKLRDYKGGWDIYQKQKSAERQTKAGAKDQASKG